MRLALFDSLLVVLFFRLRAFVYITITGRSHFVAYRPSSYSCIKVVARWDCDDLLE